VPKSSDTSTWSVVACDEAFVCGCWLGYERPGMPIATLGWVWLIVALSGSEPSQGASPLKERR
jgi:hypothetical protein